MKFKLFFVAFLIPNIVTQTHAMESDPADAIPVLVLGAAAYGTSVARAYCDKFALKLLTNTESDVRFRLTAQCRPRRSVPYDSITALVYAIRPLAGAATGAAVTMLPDLVDAVSENLLSPGVKQMIKHTGRIIIIANVFQYIPVNLRTLNYQTDGYKMLENFKANQHRNIPENEALQ